MKKYGNLGMTWIGHFLLIAAFSAISFQADAQTPRLILKIDSTTVCPSGSGYASVYLTNPLDSIAGFEVLIQVNNPDLITLPVSVDTVGSAISGFEFVSASSPTPGTSIRIVALVNNFGGPQLPALAPDTAPRLLFRFPYTAFAVPDTTTERTTLLIINTSFATNFGFSNQNGQLIGVGYIEDTTEECYRCNQWVGSDCLDWMRVQNPPCDSVAFVLDTFAILDTAQVKVYGGAVLITPPVVMLGDINNDGNPFSIADLVELIRYITQGDPPLFDPRRADLNGDCRIDCQDAHKLDSCFTFGCPGLTSCVCDNPVRYCCCGIRGNTNGDIDDAVTVADLVFLVQYLFVGNLTQICIDEANVNAIGGVTVADLTRLVSYLFNSGPAPEACP